MFLDTTKITADTDLSCVDLSTKTLQVLLCSLIYIHCCGVTIASLFPLSYKTSVCIQSHVAMFKQKGILLHPTRADCYFRTLKLDANRSLQSYGVRENDTLVFHDRELCAGDWQRVIRSLQGRIEELEKRVEEDEEVIGVLSSELQKPLFVCCEFTCVMSCNLRWLPSHQIVYSLVIKSFTHSSFIKSHKDSTLHNDAHIPLLDNNKHKRKAKELSHRVFQTQRLPK